MTTSFMLDIFVLSLPPNVILDSFIAFSCILLFNLSGHFEWHWHAFLCCHYLLLCSLRRMFFANVIIYSFFSKSPSSCHDIA